jgi:hypothetical protein
MLKDIITIGIVYHYYLHPVDLPSVTIQCSRDFRLTPVAMVPPSTPNAIMNPLYSFSGRDIDLPTISSRKMGGRIYQ